MKEEFQNICPNCFAQSMYGGQCRNCGYTDVPINLNSMQLPRFFVLYERYILGRVLGAGGFGITYKAYDILNNSLCAVKEFVPIGISARYMDGITLQASSEGQEDNFEHGKKRFLEEADVLKQLRNIPEVVQITDYFTENNTVYYVMEYLDGVTLKRMMNSMGGRLPYREAAAVIYRVGMALEEIHNRAHIFHRDISPENIMITQKGEVKLIDFGSAKYLIGQRSQNLSVVLKPGFAPPEQYTSTGRQGSYTDVYALAGTFYYAVSGVMVPEAPERLSGNNHTPLKNMDLGISEKVSDEVDRALALNYRNRTQTAGEFVQHLKTPVITSRPKERRPWIRGRYAGGAEQMWYLPCDCTVKVGRSSAHSEIVLQNDMVISKLHFEIRYVTEEDTFYICDRSTNGVYFGDRRLRKGMFYKLRDGDSFVIGKKIYTFKVGRNE